MDYPCRENKDADQLRGYCEADLRLGFRICRLFVFSRGGSYIAGHYKNTPMKYTEMQKLKIFCRFILIFFLLLLKTLIVGTD